MKKLIQAVMCHLFGTTATTKPEQSFKPVKSKKNRYHKPIDKSTDELNRANKMISKDINMMNEINLLS